MSDKLSQLERLNKLLDEGRISESEYTDLKTEVLNESGDEQVVTHSPDDSAEARPTLTPPALTKATDTPTIYKVALGAGIVSIFFGGTFGILAWATVALGAAALLSEKTAHRRWMAWTGLALGLVFSFVNAYLNGHLDSLGIGQQTAIAADLPVDDDLVLKFSTEDFIGRWNDQATDNNRIDKRPPTDSGGLLDSGGLFVNHFDEEFAGSNITIWHALRDRDTRPHSFSLSHNPEISTFDDLLTRWKLLCASIYDSGTGDDCLERTMSGLGVSSDSGHGNWIGPYVAEFLDSGLCWQINVDGPEHSHSVFLQVDIAANSRSVCRSEVL